MDYFVVVKGKTISQNVNKKNAIERAKKEYDKGNTDVGIGRTKIINGKYMYKLLPLYFFV
jgi:uncharacterized membrane protein